MQGGQRSLQVWRGANVTVGCQRHIPEPHPSLPSGRARPGVPQLQGRHPLGDSGSHSVWVPHRRACGSNPRRGPMVDALLSVCNVVASK